MCMLCMNIPDNEIDLAGYTIVRKDRSESAQLNGGEVMFCVRENGFGSEL